MAGYNRENPGALKVLIWCSGTSYCDALISEYYRHQKKVNIDKKEKKIKQL